MSRIQTPALISDAPIDAQPSLETINNSLGSVPNIFRIIANTNYINEVLGTEIDFPIATELAA